MLHLMTQIAMTNRKFAWGLGKKLHSLFATACQETHTQAHPLPAHFMPGNLAPPLELPSSLPCGLREAFYGGDHTGRK